ncbi:HU family DNA-binding protein [Yinghuangia seranimata]|uniref:HU family DNA-binding protein n=1 Tax=Yinghuangia seranimata TaxID=408067 RepID=UPI00248CC95A|nr:HU family DNA-binding protein [Yinghuangia seranimata]MDI2129318.1 HU family DNA-binding protein [Yinghuangia seranimata]
MNKAQLVEAVQDRLGGRTAAADAVDAVLDAIIRAVAGGDRVSITGFGSFEKVERAARYARNPQTGERVRVKKTAIPRFRPGQGFKDLTAGTKKMPKSGSAAAKASPTPRPGTAAKKTAAKKATTARATATRKAATTRKTAAAAKPAATRKTAAAAKPAAKKATVAKKTAAKKTAVKATAKKTAAKTTAKKATKRAAK